MVDDIIHIKESGPATNVTLHLTVPVTSSMTLNLAKSIGLDISDCSVQYSASKVNQTITVEALKSSSSFSRIARIIFGTINSPGSPWHGYKPAYCPVMLAVCYTILKLVTSLLHYYTALSRRIKCCTWSACLSVRPSSASDFLQIGKP